MKPVVDCESIAALLQHISPFVRSGRVLEVAGPLVRTTHFGAALGDLAAISNGTREVLAEVVAFSHNRTVLSPLGDLHGITAQASVQLASVPAFEMDFGTLLGKVVDAYGSPLGSPHPGRIRSMSPPPTPLERNTITKRWSTGIFSIDAFVTIGEGQRLAVLAEPGVGKSTLLSMIAGSKNAEINVIALIGERGREVREWIDTAFSPATKQRTVIVASTSDEPALRRIRAAETAIAIAEHYRDQGNRVFLAIDSLTRFVRAYREVGLAAGEIPVRKGYPPSAFSALPKLLERIGNTSRGSITGLFTVLLSSDLEDDPMVEEIKSLTDGHIVLSRERAERGAFPAIDIFQSLSRLQAKLLEKNRLHEIFKIRAYLARLVSEGELELLSGQTNPKLERLRMLEVLFEKTARQAPEEIHTPSETEQKLDALIRCAQDLGLEY